MTIGIQGVRVKQLVIAKDDKGMLKPTGTYELVGTNGRVLATQSFNAYADMQVPASPDTVRLMDAMLKGVVADIEGLLGLEATP